MEFCRANGEKHKAPFRLQAKRTVFYENSFYLLTRRPPYPGPSGCPVLFTASQGPSLPSSRRSSARRVGCGGPKLVPDHPPPPLLPKLPLASPLPPPPPLQRNWPGSGRGRGAGAQQLLIVPFAGDAALFAHSSVAAPRYLIVAKQSANTLDGKILEFILPRTTLPVDTLALFTSLYRSYQRGSLVAPAQGEGYVFLYSATYQYLTGRRFEQGRFLPGAARLAFQPHPGSAPGSSAQAAVAEGGATTNMAPPIGAPCLDWYSGETGKYITTTGDCSGLGSGGSGEAPPVYTGGGGPCGGNCGSPGPSGYGGGGGGGSSTSMQLTSTMVLVNRPDVPVTNIKQYLKCFDTNQPATLTVYARQPVQGTNDTYAFRNLKPDVGHSFISITQNGITRVMGFYPTSPLSIFVTATGIFGDNSQTAYTAKASMLINGGNLYSLLQYIYSTDGKNYDLQTYNCIDFAIQAAHAAGVDLPDTWGRWGGIGGGSNPGSLGNDLIEKPLPATVEKGGAGTSPSNKGTC